MNCASCGQANDPDRLECESCDALLVDVFASADEAMDEKTDPIERLGASRPRRETRGRIPLPHQYTGDLPRLFRFGERYQILEKLGEGGMGRVYKALDLELDRPVALKTIRAEKGTGPELLKRFKQELVLARKVTHKNVVRIYDLGEDEGIKFFTMELVEGRSLRDVLKERGRLPAKEAVVVLKQLLSGLAEAHSQGVIHRDLKPQNIMVDERDNIRIMDFGIARTADTATMTGTGEMMGTPDYISPEQVKGENADAQSDLYSLGVILYEMLTGEVPFKGDTAVSRIVSRLQSKPSSPRSLCPGVPAYLDRIVVKLMEADPDLRYKTADDVLQDLEREQVDLSIVLRARKLAARYRVWFAAACFAASLGLGGWLYWRSAVHGANVTTLAVVPLTNLRSSDELDWLEEGIPQMLVSNIAQSDALRPVLTERVHRILRDLGKEGDSRFDPETIRVIAQTAPADYTLFGSFVESGGELRLSLTLRETSTGVDVPVGAAGPASAVFDIVDALTEAVESELGAARWGRAPEGPTESVEAFRAYTQGLEALRNGANQDAIALFGEATRLDPSFAAAHARLAEAHFQRNDVASARAAIENALPLLEHPSLSVVDRYQIQATAARISEDPARAVEAHAKLAELYPDDPDTQLGYASAIETLGENGKAARQYQRVLELNPDFGAALLGLARSLNSSGKPEEAIGILRSALESERFDGDREAQGMAYSVLGVALRDMGRHEEAIPFLQMSLDARKQAGDVRGVTATLTNLGVAHRKMGHFDLSEELLRDALVSAKAERNETMESFALLNLGNLYMDKGELESALTSYLDSLAIEQERKEHLELGHRLANIANVHTRRGRLAEATVFVEQAKDHSSSSGDQRELGFSQFLEGEISRAKGQYRRAVEAYLKGLSILQGTGSSESVAETQRALARVYADQGRFDECFRALSLSVSGYRALGSEQQAGISLLELARVGLDLGIVSESESILAMPEVRSLETTPQRSERHLIRAALERAQGHSSRATALASAIVAEARSREAAPVVIRAQIELGTGQTELGRARDATETLRSAYDDAFRLRLRSLQADASLQLAEAYLTLGDFESALAFGEESRRLADDFEALPLALRAHSMLARIAAKRGDRTMTVQHESAARQITEELLNGLDEDASRSSDPTELLPEITSLEEALRRVLASKALNERPTRSGDP